MFNQFTLFGPLHLLVILVMAIGVVVIFLTRTNKQVKYVLAGVLIAQILAFNTKHIVGGTYQIGNYLPLHLCTLSAILAPLALLTKNKIIQTLFLFWGLVPALLAVLFPDVSPAESYTSFRFWEFFVSHVFIVLSALYVAIHSDSKFMLNKFSTWKQIIVAYLVLVMYTIGIVIPINYLLNSNYLYMTRKASNGMGFLPDGQLYGPSLFVMALLVFILEAVIYSLFVSYKQYAKDKRDLME
jgi:hypothetical integral membrane protein (TIGR02206 family)